MIILILRVNIWSYPAVLTPLVMGRGEDYNQGNFKLGTMFFTQKTKQIEG